MAKARDKVRVAAHARIAGIVFWDRPHNVTGRAPNAIELHPILRFVCFAKEPPPPLPPGGGKCAASYPTVCIPPAPPDLNCGDIPYRNFRVRWDVANPDPHGFDGDRDGVGCES